jgi:aminoglycoside phosphotransferase (APT) family kinase protein
VRIFDWCRDHQPEAPPSCLLWGDVRLGNMLVDDHMRPTAVLDWEMASIGPPEVDVAWYTALEAMTEHFVGTRVPGFLRRDEVVSHLERSLGRSLVDLEWFEVFAMARSAALNLRADRLRAQERGRPARPTEDDAIIAYTIERIPDLAC